MERAKKTKGENERRDGLRSARSARGFIFRVSPQYGACSQASFSTADAVVFTQGGYGARVT